MPWIGFVFLMGHMSVNHINRQFISRPDKVDITGALTRPYLGSEGRSLLFQERKWSWS
jgi:hypothetical protein